MNLLYLTHRVPDPPNRGDRIRAHHLLRFLSERGRVHLACLADEPVLPETRGRLEACCEQLAIAPVGARSRWVRASLSVGCGRTATEGLFASPELHRVVRNWARYVRFDAIVVFCSSMLQYVTAPELAGVPLVVDLVDVDSQKWFDYAARSRGLKRQLFELEGRRLRRLESRLPPRVRGITLVSEHEASLFRSFCPNDRTYGIANGVDLDYFQPQDAGREPSGAIAFVGALDYRANVEGLRWFVAHVWPELRRRQPQLKFQMVGRCPTPAIVKLAEAPGVELVGEVPDVRPHLATADVVVAPLQIARGIQNKVLEALAAGKTVVASPQALEGLAVEPGRHAIEAGTPQQWIAELDRLTHDPAACAELGREGRQFVEQHHDWQSCLRPFAELLGLDGQPAAAPRAGAMRHV